MENCNAQVSDGEGNVVLRTPDTISAVFAGKIEQFMTDKEHIYNKFFDEPPKASDIFNAAKFSSSKWGRIMSGEVLDIERKCICHCGGVASQC